MTDENEISLSDLADQIRNEDAGIVPDPEPEPQPETPAPSPQPAIDQVLRQILAETRGNQHPQQQGESDFDKIGRLQQEAVTAAEEADLARQQILNNEITRIQMKMQMDRDAEMTRRFSGLQGQMQTTSVARDISGGDDGVAAAATELMSKFGPEAANVIANDPANRELFMRAARDLARERGALPATKSAPRAPMAPTSGPSSVPSWVTDDHVNSLMKDFKIDRKTALKQLIGSSKSPDIYGGQ